MTLTQAQQEALYDLTRLSPVTLANPELPALRAQPTILDVATARQRALVDWEGRTKIIPSGALRRSPMLPEVEIGQLEDGTPVTGDFDADDTPLCAYAAWEGFSIIASADGFELTDDETDKDHHHFTVDQWDRLKTLVNSDIVDQVLHFGRAWEAQRHSATTEATPVAEVAPAPAHTLDPNDINVKAGGVAAVLTFLLRKLDTDRADGLIALINAVEQAPATQRDQMVDALLATVTPLKKAT